MTRQHSLPLAFQILLALLFCISPYQTFAQSSPHHLRMLGVEHGLSNDIVVDIAQDKHHTLWFATEDGLNRFDLNSFHTYRKTTHPLSANELNCILDDPLDSTLWIGTQREGLARLDYTNDSITVYRHDNSPEGLSANSITDLQPASDGNIWIATYWGGVNKYNRTTNTFTHYNQTTVPSLPSNQTWTVTEGPDSTLYIGHVYDGLTVLDLRTLTSTTYRPNSSEPYAIPSQQVYCIYIDHLQHVWVGTSDGLALFDPATDRFHHYSDASPLFAGATRSIYQTDEHRLWIATDQSQACIIDPTQNVLCPATMTVENIMVNNSDLDNSNTTISSILQDHHDNIWIANRPGGIAFLGKRAPLFVHYTKSPYLSNEYALNNPYVSCITTSADGTLWAGTDGGGFNIFSNGKRTSTLETDNGNIPGNNILSAHLDSDGTLWAGIKNDGLYHVDPQGNARRIIDNSEVRCIYSDTTHHLWVGTSQGVYCIDKKSRTVAQRFECPVNFIWSVLPAPDGTIWVGTFGGGLFHYDANHNVLAHMHKDNGFPSNTINHLHFDTAHRLWAATGEGLVCISSADTIHKVIGTTDGLKNSHIQAIAEDSDSNIWFSTNQGIGCYHTQLDTVLNFHSTVGIPHTNFIAGSSAHTPDGTIWFGSSSGLCSFRPDQVLTTELAPQVIITELRIPQPLYEAKNVNVEKHILPRQHLTFSHTHNTFDIYFSVDDYALSDQVEYAYRIVGLNDKWYSNGNNRRVNFSNLPPGNYSFEVRARIHGGKWNGPTASLSLTVKPSPWLTPWAKAIYICIALALITTFVLFRRHKKRLEKEIRQRAREIRRINRLAKDFKEEATTLREEATELRQKLSMFKKEKDDHLNQALSEQDTEFLVQLSNLIEQEMSSEKLDVAWLAQAAGMSESTLYRKVKTLTGGSTNDFIRRIRIHKAEQLILSGKYTISEIGYMVGYGSPSNFRRAFKEEFGLSPTGYINALKDKD